MENGTRIKELQEENERLRKEIEQLSQENEKLKSEVADLSGRLSRKGRVKDSEWMTKRRDTFVDLYNNGESRGCIIEKMEISSKTYDRLKQYALLANRITDKKKTK